VADFDGPLPPVPADGEHSLNHLLQKVETQMKNLTTITLMVNFAIASVHAQQTPVKMTFSGTGAASTIDLKYPNTHTGETNLAGKGMLGQFTFRLITAGSNGPQPSTTCVGLYFQIVAGGGIFRFQDGSLLYVALTGGADCIDLVHMMAHCTRTFKINGGTGRFEHASGTLTLTETVVPVLADATNNPVFFSGTGEITGTISGVAQEENDDVRR
jgi:hypothetical protein